MAAITILGTDSAARILGTATGPLSAEEIFAGEVYRALTRSAGVRLKAKALTMARRSARRAKLAARDAIVSGDVPSSRPFAWDR